MEVGLEIGTSDILGNEVSENRSGGLFIFIIKEHIVSISSDRE